MLAEQDLSQQNDTPVRVLLAHTDEEIREKAAPLLRNAGYEVISVCDGESARLLLLDEEPPALLVCGVALRTPYFYELCQLINEQNLPIKILLITSTHAADAYKRAPTKLYGADGFVEQQNLELLTEKMRELLI